MPNSTDPASSPGADRVECEIEIAAPPERVWHALTDASQLFQWWGTERSVRLVSFTMDARVGGQWSFCCTPIPPPDQGEAGPRPAEQGTTEFVAHGSVLELDPPRVLAWSWSATWHDDPARVTTVRWELTPVGGGTRVRVIHSGLAREPAAHRDYGSGWRGMLKLLAASLDGTAPGDANRG